MSKYLSDLNENKIVFDVNVVIIASIFNVFVSLGEESAESIVRVNNCELRSFPAELSSARMEIPDGLGDEEIVVLNLTIEVVGWDVEKCLTTIEVKVNTVAL